MATETAQAGTTGVITGTVLDEKTAPIVGARVTATSTTDIEKTTTDPHGHFVFLALPPNIYTITLEKKGFIPLAFAGITVFADNSLALNFKMPTELRVVAILADPSYNSLVSRRVTSDLYDVFPGEFIEGMHGTPFMLQTLPGIVVGAGGSIPL